MVSIALKFPWSRRRKSQSKLSHAKLNLQGILDRHDKQQTHIVSTITPSAETSQSTPDNQHHGDNTREATSSVSTIPKISTRNSRWFISEETDSDHQSLHWSIHSSLSSVTNLFLLPSPHGTTLGSSAKSMDLPDSMMYPRVAPTTPNASSYMLNQTTGLQSSTEPMESPFFVYEDQVLFSRIQNFSRKATRDSMLIKSILQGYPTTVLLTDLPADVLDDIHECFESLYQAICQLQELLREMNEDICKNLAYIRYECAIAEGDVLFAKLPQRYFDDSATARNSPSSGLLLVADEVLRNVHQIPLVMIAPHVISSNSPVVSQLKRWWNTADGHVKTRNRNATVLRMEHNDTPRELQSSLFRNDRLDALRSLEASVTLCGDVLHFSIVTHAVFCMPPAQRPSISWSAAATPEAILMRDLSINAIRDHVAQHLDIPSYKFELWVRNKKLEEGEEDMLYSSTHNVVQVVLDPTLNVLVNGTSTMVVDLAAHLQNKAFIPIGFIKKRLREMLGTGQGGSLRLYLEKEELLDDQMTLFGTGLLDTYKIEGRAPINLKADYSRPTKTCITCLDNKYNNRFVIKITKSCTHPTNVCKKCLRKWIDERLDNNGTTIPCPECRETLEHDDVRKCSTKEQFEKYDRLTLLAILSQDPNFHWCLSPTCKSGQVHTSANPIFACTACGHKQCITHQTDWHENETCAEYNNRVAGSIFNVNEKASQKKIEETTKACPQCKARIEKNYGCDHMTCSLPSCKFQFCWECSCDWVKASNDASYHVKTCKYYRAYGPR